MAKFNEVVSPLAVNPHISPGVRDEAMAGLLKNIGSIGVNAYKGYETAGLQKKITGVADEFFAREEAAQSGESNEYIKEFGALKLGEEELLLSGIPEPQVQSSYIKEMDKRLSNFSQAAKQGRMSLSELQTRILSSTREAITRNPMLQQELLVTADKYMESSGLGSFIKEQEKLQKAQMDQQRDFLKEIDTEGNKRSIPNWFDMDITQKLQALDITRRRDYAINELEAQGKLGNAISEQQAETWVSIKGKDALNGHLSRVNVAMQQVFQDVGPNNFGAVKYKGGELIDGAKREFDNLIPTHLRTNPKVKELRESYVRNLDAMKERLDRLGSGEDYAIAWKNEMAKVQAIQEWDVRKTLNLEKANLGIRLMGAFPSSMLDEGNLERAKDFYSALMGGMFQSEAGLEGLPKVGNNNPSASTGVLQASVNIGIQEKDWSPFKQIVSSYNKGLVSISDPKQRLWFISKNIEALSKMDMPGLDVEGVAGVQDMIKSYFNDPSFGRKALFAAMKKYPGNKMEFLDDGRLLFVGPDAPAFNSKFGVLINQTLELYAKANGQSIKEASTTFYEIPFGKRLTYDEAQANRLADQYSTEKLESLLKESNEALAKHGPDDELEQHLANYQAALDIKDETPQPTPSTIKAKSTNNTTLLTPSVDLAAMSVDELKNHINGLARQEARVRKAGGDTAGLVKEWQTSKQILKAKEILKKEEQGIERPGDASSGAITSVTSLSDMVTTENAPAIAAIVSVLGASAPALILNLAKKMPKVADNVLLPPKLSNIGTVKDKNGKMLSVGATRAMITAMKNDVKKQKEELFKDYFKKKLYKQDSGLALPTTSDGWASIIADANHYVERNMVGNYDTILDKAMKSVGGKYKK